MLCEARTARLILVRMWVDKARYAGGDIPSARCHRDFMLEERDDREDGLERDELWRRMSASAYLLGGFDKVARAPGVSDRDMLSDPGEGQGMTVYMMPCHGQCAPGEVSIDRE